MSQDIFGNNFKPMGQNQIYAPAASSFNIGRNSTATSNKQEMPNIGNTLISDLWQ
jgi:hypothetical protein